ncbi:hypothetical protein GCM10009678_89640 [Actinomadura kijaniata]|uniref:type I polyketide synthase n=1 Tax=Actinomadura kijaniata TaxID=46161 RepID=UPI002FE8F72A
MTDIAIVGLDCRFPKAPDVPGLWNLLINGEEGVSEVPRGRWHADDYYDPEGGRAKVNTRSAGFIDDPDVFDHEFFDFSEAELEVSDPQMRLLLQAAWRAVEDATLDPRSLAGSRTGVYVGIMAAEWLNLLMTDFQRINPHVGSGNGYAMAANRISFHLDLRGPCMAIDTACSSSLVATEQACAALRAGTCDQALVGAVNLFVTPVFGVFLTQAKLSSPDGRCRPFSSEANGFGRAEGVGVMVLRRLEDALAEGLPVYAVIRGAAVNHGGRSTTVTAPNPHAQRAAMVEAYERAGVRPQDISYVEAHGTGTMLGDRIEVRALGQVHGVPRERPCAIGSIKGNIGHAEGAAGLAGLIKTTLALHHRVIPPSPHATTENPRLRLAQNGLQLVKEPMPLPSEGEVLAGVSGFGLGGTNAHIVLATAPPEARRPYTGRPGGGLLTVSARDRESLRGAVRRLADDVAAALADRFAAVAWTSNKVKASGPVRFALPARDREEAVAGLRAAAADDDRLAALSGEAGTAPAVGWTIAGESAWRPGMSRELYERHAAYRHALAAADAALRPELDWSVAEALWSGAEPPARGPVVFAVAYALGQMLLDAGVTPAWIVGEGAGAHAAAVLAGNRKLEEAARAVAAPDGPGAAVEATAGEAGGAGSRPPATRLHLVDDGSGFDEALRTAVEAAPARVVEIVGERTEGARLLPGRAGGGEVLDVVAALYRDGLDPDWDVLYDPGQRVRHRLTPYVFAPTARLWWNGPIAAHGDGDATAALVKANPAGGVS